MSTAGKGRLTTHVLDTASGEPAAGLEIALYRLEGETRVHVKTVTTNSDGRCDAPLLDITKVCMRQCREDMRRLAARHTEEILLPRQAAHAGERGDRGFGGGFARSSLLKPPRQFVAKARGVTIDTDVILTKEEGYKAMDEPGAAGSGSVGMLVVAAAAFAVGAAVAKRFL